MFIFITDSIQAAVGAPAPVFKRPKMIKNPNAGEFAAFLRSLSHTHQRAAADTSFLPDKAREELAEVTARICFCTLV